MKEFVLLLCSILLDAHTRYQRGELLFLSYHHIAVTFGMIMS